MKLTNTLTIISLATIIFSCSKPEEKVVNPADYEVYLKRDTNESLRQLNTEMAFWTNRLNEVPDGEANRSKIAGLLAARFMITGEIEDIQKSDSIYKLILAGDTLPRAGVHRAIATNSITQHQFRKAKREINEALAIGEGKAASLFMSVDVDIELGDYEGANYAMSQLADRGSFPYLIRKAKIEDHEGRLDSAIVLMKKALVKVSFDKSLALWTQSNLGDMYGHAGRVRESYDAYLQVLRRDPDYEYALKGIAWIAFSHDHNNAEAKRIVQHLEPKRALPDMHLLLAQIAAAENNIPEKERQLALFVDAARSPKYGDMYNKYLALLEAEEFSNPSKTIEIALKEIKNRPTPQSYDLLAWGYLQKGDVNEAYSIAQEHLDNKTFEPDALYHLGMIYKAKGLNKQARHYFKQAAESSFELGPDKAKKIQAQLRG